MKTSYLATRRCQWVPATSAGTTVLVWRWLGHSLQDMSDSCRPSARCREEGVAVARQVVDEQAELPVKGEAGKAERGAGVARPVQACWLGAKDYRIGQHLQLQIGRATVCTPVTNEHIV